VHCLGNAIARQLPVWYTLQPRRMFCRFLLFSAVLSSACFPPLCEVSTPIAKLDGGTAVCLKAEDCPRPSDVFVCTTTADISSKCVNCLSTMCVTVTQETCK
jgi:hypothetical protein